MTVLFELIDGQREVRIERDGETTRMLTTQDGVQCAVVPVDDELLVMMHTAIESVMPSAFTSTTGYSAGLTAGLRMRNK